MPTTRVGFTQYGKPTFLIPSIFSAAAGDAGTLLRDMLLAFSPVIGLTPDDLALFRRALLANPHLVRRASDRRIRAGSAGGSSSAPKGDRPSYQKFLATGFTRSLVAAKARKASARTVGDMFMQMMLTFLDPTSGAADRLLDGPTNLVWIDPWLSYLESQGVQLCARDRKSSRSSATSERITGVAVRRHGDSGRVV